MPAGESSKVLVDAPGSPARSGLRSLSMLDLAGIQEIVEGLDVNMRRGRSGGMARQPNRVQRGRLLGYGSTGCPA